MTREDMLALLREGHNDPSTFDNRSVKTLDDFWSELQKGEATLELDPVKGLLRRSKSSKLIIRTNDGSWSLLEKKRVYPGKPPIVKQTSYSGLLLRQPNWTISETGRPGESPFERVLRGLREELKMFLDIRNAVSFIQPINLDYSAVIDEHPSSVFDGVTSLVETVWFVWLVKERFGGEEILCTDLDGEKRVELHLKWERGDEFDSSNDLIVLPE